MIVFLCGIFNQCVCCYKRSCYVLTRTQINQEWMTPFLHYQNHGDICQTVQFWEYAIYRSMNSLIGIEIGFGSHVVSLAAPSAEGATEPKVDVVLNEKKESENK